MEFPIRGVGQTERTKLPLESINVLALLVRLDGLEKRAARVRQLQVVGVEIHRHAVELLCVSGYPTSQSSHAIAWQAKQSEASVVHV